jgi:hypothetical protein
MAGGGVQCATEPDTAGGAAAVPARGAGGPWELARYHRPHPPRALPPLPHPARRPRRALAQPVLAHVRVSIVQYRGHIAHRGHNEGVTFFFPVDERRRVGRPSTCTLKPPAGASERRAGPCTRLAVCVCVGACVCVCGRRGTTAAGRGDRADVSAFFFAPHRLFPPRLSLVSVAWARARRLLLPLLRTATAAAATTINRHCPRGRCAREVRRHVGPLLQVQVGEPGLPDDCL